MLIYDLEIKKAIPGKNPQDDIHYCEGWTDYEGMGISVLCCYDNITQRYRFFCDDNKDQFVELFKVRKVFVGFNNISFDNKVLKACWGIEIPEERTYDILAKLRKIQGHFKVSSLDKYCKANVGMGKEGSGADAPIHWQRGEYGSLFDYVFYDVMMTKELMDRIMVDGCIMDPKTGESVSICYDREVYFGQESNTN